MIKMRRLQNDECYTGKISRDRIGHKLKTLFRLGAR